MDLSADTAFANNTRPGTPVPPSSRSVLSSPNPGESSKERRDSNSTIRPTGSEVDQQGVEVKEGSGESGEASGSRLKESTTVEQDKEVGLEKEVGQVVQQLSSWGGSFWGGFRKQVSEISAWKLMAVSDHHLITPFFSPCSFSRALHHGIPDINLFIPSTCASTYHGPSIPHTRRPTPL